MKWVLRPQKNGISQKRVLNGTKNMQENQDLVNLTTGSICVSSAGRNIEEKQNMQSFAIQTAKLKTCEIVESWKEQVYDLTVEDAHEYFANGILVHNCMDSLRYAVYTKLNRPKFEVLAW